MIGSLIPWAAMAKCPECGGVMISQMKRKVCETCGLSLTVGEYDRAWDGIKDKAFDKNNPKKKEHNEYLDWYLKKDQDSN